MNRSICVYCGSSSGIKPEYVTLARELGAELAKQNHRLVYGGGGLGLMGAVARAAHDAGGDVLGIIPEFLKAAEKTFTEVEHVFVPDMHTRKIRMFEEADAFIVLPGGIGTLEEVIEVLSWLRLNLHQKPIICLSDTGYWDRLEGLMEHMVTEGFAPASLINDVQYAADPIEALSMIEQRIKKPLPRKSLNLSVSDTC